MANRINLTNSVVTAGKFVATEDDSAVLTQKVRALSNQINLNTSSNRVSAISSIFSDNVITPEEKRSLHAELNHMEAAFTATTSSVRQMGLENSVEYLQYKQAFESMKSKIEPILANMSTSTTVTEPISSYVQAYTSAGVTLSAYMIAFSNSSLSSVQDFQLKVEVNTVSPTPSDVLKFTAKILMKDETGFYKEFTEEQYNTYKVIDSEGNVTYPKLFIWEISGTTDDAGYKANADGYKSVTIPASAYKNDSISVKFYADILIS